MQSESLINGHAEIYGLFTIAHNGFSLWKIILWVACLNTNYKLFLNWPIVH